MTSHLLLFYAFIFFSIYFFLFLFMFFFFYIFLFFNRSNVLGLCLVIPEKDRGLEVTGGWRLGVYADQMSELSWGWGGAAGEDGREVGGHGCSQLPWSMEGRGVGELEWARVLGWRGGPCTTVKKKKDTDWDKVTEGSSKDGNNHLIILVLKSSTQYFFVYCILIY